MIKLPSPSLIARLASLCLIGFAPGLAGQSTPAEPSGLPFRNSDLPVAQRVEDLIGRFTVEEKISQLMMTSPAIPRLDIPEYDWWNEALHGVARNGIATVFPQAIGFAATWNPELIQRMADAIATEARAKNNEAITKKSGGSARYEGLTIWSPNINIFRDPRWGRGQETYGEDPFLTGRYGVAFVRGLSPCTAGRNRSATNSTLSCPSAICARPICRPSKLASARAVPHR